MTIYEELEQLFKEQGYKWRIGGQLVEPTAQEIEKVLTDLKVELYNKTSFSQAMAGRLVLQKIGNKFDIYVYHGTI